jgi:uncharacterized protein (DUF1697 family)
VQHVALLRAINVGGHAVIRMTDLRDLFVAAGCANVKTYIQSGNVVFDASTKETSSLFRKILAGLTRRLGKEPGIVFRTVDELEHLVRTSPFARRKPSPDEKLYVVFLSGKPERAPTLPMVSEKDAVEAVVIEDLHIFMVSRPRKNGQYGFPNALAEKELGVAATTRNWNTVVKIVEFARPSRPR